MSTSVELYTMAVEYTENTGSALVATYLPNVIDGVTRVVHIDNGLFAVEFQTGFQCFWMSLLA